MSKIALTDIDSLQNETTALSALNANYAAITTAFDNTLSRDGAIPDTMVASLDMNSNQILNLPTPTSQFSPVRVVDLNNLAAITVSPLPSGGTTGQVLSKLSNTSLDAGWTSLGVDANVLNAITANYTVQASDTGKTIQAGSGATGFFSITLPAVSGGGFNPNGIITITNGDSTRGKLLINFPFDVWPILYPRQTIQLRIVNGDWAVAINPGEWYSQNPAGVVLYVDHVNGSDTIADGLSTGTSAFKTIFRAYQVLQLRVKSLYNVYPIIQVQDTAFTENPPIFVGSATPLGPVIIKGNPASPSSCVWTTTGIVADDGAVIGINGFTCRTAGSGQTFLTVTKLGIVSHQNCIWSSATAGTHVQIVGGGVFVWDGGTYQVGDAFSAPNCMATHVQNLGGTWAMPIGGTITVPNVLNFTQWYDASGVGALFAPSGFVYTGAGSGAGSTGLQFNLRNNATMTTSFSFPGATAGTFTTGASVNDVVGLTTVTTASGNVVTFPSATVTLVGKTTTDTLTNKTLTAPVITSPVITLPTIDGASPAQRMVVTRGINFNSANTDTSIAIPLPSGFTRYQIQAIILGNASSTLVASTFGVFSAAAAGGTAVVASGTASAVTASAAETAANFQSATLTATGATALDFANLFFRVQTAKGSAVTADVTVIYYPLS